MTSSTVQSRWQKLRVCSQFFCAPLLKYRGLNSCFCCDVMFSYFCLWLYLFAKISLNNASSFGRLQFHWQYFNHLVFLWCVFYLWFILVVPSRSHINPICFCLQSFCIRFLKYQGDTNIFKNCYCSDLSVSNHCRDFPSQCFVQTL